LEDPPDLDRHPPKNGLRWIVPPLIALIVIANLGDALAPGLVDTHPLLVIMMNARNRNLILVTGNLDPISYYVVGTLRLLISDPLFFLLGYWYGEAALHWMEKRTKTLGEVMRTFEQGFGKAAYPLVFVAPNNFICLFAGAAGMSVPVFFVINLAGTAVRLYLIRWLGDQFESPIDAVLNFIKEYRFYLLAVSVPLSGFFFWRELKGGEIEGLTHLEEELDAEESSEGAEREDSDS
jgi:membrane protein DedA with SNARE-associated domain